MTKERSLILVVEDDDPSYLYIESLLRQIPVDILRAVNGKDAVSFCYENGEIDIILMDLKMPIMDGLDATRRIKAMRKSLPIIAITAYAFTGDEKVAMDAGCDEYLTKPVKKELLFTKLAVYGIPCL
jgi:two-component system, cell cycle response regulator DivK